jgi:hypothetical protein
MNPGVNVNVPYPNRRHAPFQGRSAPLSHVSPLPMTLCEDRSAKTNRCAQDLECMTETAENGLMHRPEFVDRVRQGALLLRNRMRCRVLCQNWAIDVAFDRNQCSQSWKKSIDSGVTRTAPEQSTQTIHLKRLDRVPLSRCQLNDGPRRS